MSIRFRLTLLYSTILALTLIAFSLILYAIQARYTYTILRRDLAANAQGIALGIVRALLIHAPQDRQPPRPDFWQRRPGDQELRELRVRDLVHIRDMEGKTVEHPINSQETALPLSAHGLEIVQNAQAYIEIAQIEEEPWMVYNLPVLVEGRAIAVVQVARSLADRNRSLQALGGTLIVGSLLTALIAFGIGWVLSGVTLRPIHRVTQTAQEIGQARDLTRRVQYDGPNDEVGQLATTFNAMLSQLQDAYQQVARSLDMQRSFVADVSHELRTPLTTIRGNLALLSRRPPIPPEEQIDIMNDMVDESERLIRLVNDLLILARADAGRHLKSEPIDVKALIEDVCRQAKQLAPTRTILHVTPPGIAVLADRDALKQTLLVLVDNALKHTPGNVTIATRVQDHLVAIDVRDTGPGMDKETCAHLFERFHRGSNRSSTGFGLGLAIAKALVEAQQGTIAVRSEVETGSVFTINLPQARGERYEKIASVIRDAWPTDLSTQDLLDDIRR